MAWAGRASDARSLRRGPAGGSRSLRGRIFWELATLSVATALLVALVSSYVLQETLTLDAHKRLSSECQIIGSVLVESTDPTGALSGMEFDDERLTLVAADGTVLYDSDASASDLPNHADRPEVASALESGAGSSERQSQTMGYVSIYEALRLSDGTVLRLSEDRAGVMALLRSALGWIVGALAGLVIASWYASLVLSRWLMRPILGIDPTSSGCTAPYRELEPLVSRLGRQQEQLGEQMERLRSIDAMRSEFTTNVTHELKTPIASILGASELMRDGVVQPQDVRTFASRIYGDAQRLSALVSDILMLAKLDESERSLDQSALGGLAPCDLIDLARDIVDRYQDRASSAHVTLGVLDGAGGPTVVMGYPRLLDEMVGNLVENAIRYNVAGGTVAVSVEVRDGAPVVRVADTGIGILPEDQPKVFERFYRVDKSRSRAGGGTGLGLAIVKHAAKAHGARVSLVSVPGEGTTITIVFPASSWA